MIDLSFCLDFKFCVDVYLKHILNIYLQIATGSFAKKWGF